MQVAARSRCRAPCESCSESPGTSLMEKLIYLVWDRPSRSGADVRAQLIDEIAPKLLACSPRGLQMDIDDEEATKVKSMVAIPDDELPVRALVSIWVDAHDTRGAIRGGARRRRHPAGRATS